jgi:prolyl oligopeptidase
VEDVVDVLHGVAVADPYRWLEDGDDPEVVAWASAQNERTRSVLDALPDRPALRAQLERLLRAPVAVAPRLAGDRVFALERGGSRDQAVLTVRPFGDPDAPSRVLVDPAGAAADAAVAIDWYAPSPDGQLVAYGTSEGGDERSTLRVLDVDGGTHLGDVIPNCRAASVGWLPDGSAFAYTRYGYLGDDDTEGGEYCRWVWWHELGADPVDDDLLWGEDDLPDPTAWPDVRLSPDGRWMLIHVSLGWSRTDVHLIDRATGHREAIVEGAQAVTSLEVVGERLFGTTTVKAPRGRVVTASVHDPVGTWQTLVPEGDAVIEGAVVAGRSLLVAESEVAVGRVRRYGLDGSGGEVLALPGPSSPSSRSPAPPRSGGGTPATSPRCAAKPAPSTPTRTPSSRSATAPPTARRSRSSCSAGSTPRRRRTRLRS